MDESFDPLNDFSRDTVTVDGRTRTVYRLGDGPCVMVLSEMPGITPKVAAFARTLAARGFSVTMPHLFGDDGRPSSNAAYRKSLRQVCVSREFTLFATDRSSRVTQWLTSLARQEHQRCGGKGVGVVGMCLTGGFALAMMVDPVITAPVLSQPSLPFGFRPTSLAKSSVGLNARETAAVKARAEAGQCVLGMRFTRDKLVPDERFAALRTLLGDKFLDVEIDSSPSNPWGYTEAAHSVLTEELSDDPASPTRQALERVITFCGENLR